MPVLAILPKDVPARLRAVTDTRELAAILEVAHDKFVYHLRVSDNASSYESYSVPKRNGGSRNISAPKGGLKMLQAKVGYLVECIVNPHNAAHGFVPKRSIVSNAKSHLRSSFVLNIDLRDFFPTISFQRVRGMLIAPPFGLTPLAATCIARVACHKGQLPMGSPCSPVISNVLCRRLDQHLKELCKSLRCWYTRYADDITISTKAAAFPTDLASSVLGPVRRVVLSPRLLSVIHSNGFEVQDSKTRLQDRKARQVVTGVIVNKKLGLDRRRKNQVRAMLHAWEKFGYEAAEKEFHAKYDKKHRPVFKKPVSYKYVLRGKIEYLKMVLGKDHPQVKRMAAHLEQLMKAPSV